MSRERVQIIDRGRPLGGPLSVWVNFRLVPLVASILIKTLAYTLRIAREGFQPVEDLVREGDRVVLSFYHRRLVMMPQAYPFRRRTPLGEPRGVAILSSDSKDGERSAATWKWFGIHAVRGTAGDRGAQALVKMIRAVKEGWDLGITVDGPRGPRQQVKGGVLAVSRKTGAWVIPVCVAYERAWKLRTWDEMLVPKPFSKVIVRYGAPFQVPADGDEEPHRARLERELDAFETWAEAQSF
ncbi:lysophospholipid acyltransferase family protein [Mesoterricola sediminis]|uniref:DUF374 domain-containing protein n=1 Tax=Mesoterricola sediminis TaxID=2927980 RepID=A0AA48KBT5_9BACT|nr:lysophospholipid acyltransferase family protein [Mesoterricola sediminis]BDU75410.1 hypothetical protein METESE_03680 [Mesoterricola sediminis]